MSKISIVIPVYNSEKTLSELCERITKTFQEIEKEFEIILINDGSHDNSYQIAKDLAEKYSYIKFIHLSKNFGQSHALMAGFRFVSGDLVVCMDDDLQNPPEEIPKLVTAIENSFYDVIYSKYKKKNHSLFRNIGHWANQKMTTWLLNKPQNITTASFFIAKRFVIDEVRKYTKPYPHIPGLIFRITQNIGNIETDHHPRKTGYSNYTLSKLLMMWFYGFLNFSVKPLRILTFFGASVSILSFIYILILIIQKILLPHRALGWTSLMVTTTLFGGLQLFAIGLVGEYVGRMFLSINQQPQYVIKEKFNIDD